MYCCSASETHGTFAITITSVVESDWVIDGNAEPLHVLSHPEETSRKGTCPVVCAMCGARAVDSLSETH